MLPTSLPALSGKKQHGTSMHGVGMVMLDDKAEVVAYAK
jgi:hypothetical protein